MLLTYRVINTFFSTCRPNDMGVAMKNNKKMYFHHLVNIVKTRAKVFTASIQTNHFHFKLSVYILCHTLPLIRTIISRTIN